MESEVAYPHIDKPPDGPARLRRFPRIRVAQIAVDHQAYGWSAEDILRQYPFLTPAEVHASLGYYFDHQEEVDREIQAEWDEARLDHADGQPSAFRVRMRAERRL